MKKYFVVGSRKSLVASLFRGHGWEPTDNLFEADLLQYTGGEDVTPEIYNCLNLGSRNNLNRDLFEAGFYAIGRRLDIPQVGICRGGQFLNVMCGGAMLQDVKGHLGDHPITTDDGRELRATSTHHQMMIPSGRGLVLAHATIIHNTEEPNTLGMKNDPEVIYYQREKCLCFQPHPEYGRFGELAEYYLECINKYLVK